MLEHPGFVMRLVIDGDAIKFEPDFNDFEIVLINVYDVMLKAVTIVPRVETKLYSEWVSEQIVCSTSRASKVLILLSIAVDW